MKTVTIVSDDRVGLLADISYVLGKSSVNIEGLFVDVVGGKAIISIEVKDYKKASEILGSNGFKTANSEAIIIKVANDHVDKIGVSADQLEPIEQWLILEFFKTSIEIEMEQRQALPSEEQAPIETAEIPSQNQ